MSQQQLRYWQELQESNPELFVGTPSGRHFFELNIEEIKPLKIRLDVYFAKRDYTQKGTQTVSIILPNQYKRKTAKMIIGKDKSTKLWDDAESVNYREVIFKIDKIFTGEPIKENSETWKSSMDWFQHYTLELIELIKNKGQLK